MADPVNSILDSTKKALGLDPDYDVYDADLVMHINGVLATLNQLGVGPVNGYAISGAEDTWDDFLGMMDARWNGVKTYVFLKTRYVFDPPSTQFVMTAMKEQIQEQEWRLSALRESNVPIVTP